MAVQDSLDALYFILMTIDMNKRKFLIILIIAGLITIALVGSYLFKQNQKQPEIKTLGIVPCKDDNTKGIKERINTCPIIGKEKANFKSREIAKLNFTGAYTDSQTGIIVEIKDGIVTQIDGGIQIYARAWRGVNQLGFGKDGTVEWERFRIFSPPILVDDPNGTIVITDDSITDPRDKTPKTIKFREDPIAATKQTLAHTIKVSSKQGTNVVAGSIGSTVTTVFPDPGSGGALYVDGTARRDGQNTTWTAPTGVRNGVGTGNQVTPSANIQIVYYSAAAPGAGDWGQAWRSIMNFNTSAIGTDDISAAVLSVKGSSKQDDTGSTPEAGIYAPTPASTNVIVDADYNIANWGSTLLSSTVTYANWSTTAYNDFTLTATSGLSGISKTATTTLGSREVKYDVGNTAPNWVADALTNMVGISADTADTVSDPKLVITHAAAAAAGAGENSKRKVFLIE